MAAPPRKPAPEHRGAPRTERPSARKPRAADGARGRNPFAPEPEASEPLDAGAQGRRLKFGESDRRPAGPAVPAPPPQGPGGAASPFVPYGPGSDVMSRDADRARSQSLGVLAIVGGLVFMMGAAVVTTMLMLLLWMFFRDQLPETIVGATDDKGHVQDTGIADPVQPRPQPSGGVVRPEPTDGDELPDFSAVKPGPASVIVPNAILFFSIEVNCPSGYRSRGKFRKYSDGEMKATAPNVPGDERCIVTFQGSEPAKTYISGNQTLTCTFNPTECHRVY